MKILTALFCSALLVGAAHAAPIAKGDPKTGKALHDKACISCHARMFGGDGSKIYTRADRKTKTPQQLAARISGCNANTGAGRVPEDEAPRAASLALQSVSVLLLPREAVSLRQVFRRAAHVTVDHGIPQAIDRKSVV